jgi:ArsR family metal-binding transcriptional regulator
MTSEEALSIPLFIKLCSDKAAFEVRMQRKTFFNMEKVKQILEACNDAEIVVYTPQMIILRSGRAETTLSKDGRMLIKRVADESEATEVARKILRIVLSAVLKP